VYLELACACYPSIPLHKLRVCADFMNWLWHIDDVSDDMDDKSTVAIENEIMTTYRHPDTHNPKTNVGKLTKRFVSRLLINESICLIPHIVTGLVS
jgi:hypothetical protein